MEANTGLSIGKTLSKARRYFVIFALVTGCAAAVPAQDLTRAVSGTTFNRIGDYVISANDQINVKVFGQDSLTGTFTVSPTGSLTFPLVGFVSAAGRTSMQVTESLQKALRPYVKNPIITVSVAGRDSYQVYFSGEIGRPGEINLQRSTTLLQGLAMAGGLTRFASGRIVLLRQNQSGVMSRYSTTFYKLLSGKDQLDRFPLERGDYIHAE
jgi:polysaccharide biosynthesis/export protein